MLSPVAHVLIRFLPQGATDWDTLGRFHESAEVIAELRRVLEGRDPYDALPDVKHQMFRDILGVLQEQGHVARVEFIEE